MVRLGEVSITCNRPVAWARASASRKRMGSGICARATPKHRKIPNQMMAIWATSVQITDLLPPYMT